MQRREVLLEQLAAQPLALVVERVLDLEERLHASEEELAEAQAQIAELRRQLFGSKAEKLSAEQQAQMDELASDLQEEAQRSPPLTQEVLQEERRAQRRRRPPRHPLPAVLETETVTLEPECTTCPHCGSPQQKIGEEVSEEIDLIPAQLIRRRTVRPKYACRGGEAGVAIAPLPPRLIDPPKQARSWPGRPSALGALRRSPLLLHLRTDLPRTPRGRASPPADGAVGRAHRPMAAADLRQDVGEHESRRLSADR